MNADLAGKLEETRVVERSSSGGFGSKLALFADGERAERENGNGLARG